MRSTGVKSDDELRVPHRSKARNDFDLNLKTTSGFNLRPNRPAALIRSRNLNAISVSPQVGPKHRMSGVEPDPHHGESLTCRSGALPRSSRSACFDEQSPHGGPVEWVGRSLANAAVEWETGERLKN